MKTSNQLLIGLIVIIFAAIFGTATVLKSEYEKIDKDDPYYGYTSDTLADFSAIKLEGKYPNLIQIQAGDQFEIKMRDSKPLRIKWTIRNDTLVLTYPEADFPNWFTVQETLAGRAGIYIFAPKLTSVQAKSTTCKLSGWDLSNLELMQQGENSGMALTESNIGNLSATVTQGAIMRIEQPNQIKQATVAVRDVSTFITRPTAIDSLSISVDEEAQVTIPGNLLRRVNFVDE